MRLFLLILFIFEQPSGFAQKMHTHHDKWDALQTRTKAELKQYEITLQKQQHSTDTIRKVNYIIVTYFAIDKRKLLQISNYLDSNDCIRGIFSEYYNAAGLVAFRTDYKKCCPEEEADDEYKCFERTTFYERFEYDTQNRVIVHVSHMTTPITYKEIYTYSQDGSKRVTRSKIDETSFWE